MGLIKTRRSAAPIAIVTMLCFLATMLPPGRVHAQTPPPTSVPPSSDGTGGPPGLGAPTPSADAPETRASVDLSTGAFSAAFPFRLPTARGEAQPSLSLVYTSSSGPGYASMGWTFNLPTIVRRGVSGIPSFQDDVLSVNPVTSDDYLVDGQLLVPICKISAGPNGSASCLQSNDVALTPGEVLPATVPGSAGSSLVGWVYFRREIDDGARYFFSPDAQTFVMQTKAGHALQFGHPLDGLFIAAPLADGTEHPDSFTLQNAAGGSANAVYRWRLVRDSDASGNTVYYTYSPGFRLPGPQQLPDIRYLTDIYDTPPATPPSPLQLSSFAHHVHINWSALSFFDDLDPIWRATPRFKPAGVDITSATFNATTGQPRQLVRRYSLQYTQNSLGTRFFLNTITLQGTCASPVAEQADGTLPATSGCPTQQLAQYTYSSDVPISSSGVPEFVADDVTGFVAGGSATGYVAPFRALTTPGYWWPSGIIGLGNNVAEITIYPYSLADFNGDGVADLLTPSGPGSGGAAAVAYGPPGSNQQTSLSLSSSNATSLIAPLGDLIASNNVVTGDWLANGKLNFLWLNPNHQSPETGEAYTLSGGTFIGHSGLLLPGCPANVTCGAKNAIDVDGDGLTDMALLPDAQHNLNTVVTARQRTGGTSPFWRTLGGAAPHSELDPATYGPGALRLFTDFDGDGLADIVILFTNPNSGIITLQPFINRGDGRFTAPPSIPPNPGPSEVVLLNGFNDGVNLTSWTIAMGDLNGDGFADFALTDFHAHRICLQELTPTGPTFACSPATNNVTGGAAAIADVAGTGIPRAIFFGFAGTEVVGVAPDGVDAELPKPGLLTSITRLGGLRTDIAYVPSATLPGVTMPNPAWVVQSVTTSNQLTATEGRSETTTYSYSNPLYDARDRQFVGFGQVKETHSADVGAPGLVRTTSFLTQACPGASAFDCNPNLDYSTIRMTRGVVGAVEDSDTNGVHLRTTFTQFHRHQPMSGLGGRSVNFLAPTTQHVITWTALGRCSHGPRHPRVSSTTFRVCRSRLHTLSRRLPRFGTDTRLTTSETRPRQLTTGSLASTRRFARSRTGALASTTRRGGAIGGRRREQDIGAGVTGLFRGRPAYGRSRIRTTMPVGSQRSRRI